MNCANIQSFGVTKLPRNGTPQSEHHLHCVICQILEFLSALVTADLEKHLAYVRALGILPYTKLEKLGQQDVSSVFSVRIRNVEPMGHSDTILKFNM